MANKSFSTHIASEFILNHFTIRNVVSKNDKESGRNRYCGVARADALFELGWDDNVRSFLGEDDDGNKRKSTLVNQAIRETIQKERELFPILNTGVVIVARSAELDESKKTARLFGASIINGAQTVGVLKQHFKDNPSDDKFPAVNFELIVTDDEDLIGEISIARNFQNRVADLSIYGRKKLFDDLEKALQKRDKSIHLRKNETDFDEEKYVDTEKLIQALTALMPGAIEVPSTKIRRTKTPETIYRVYAYRHRARCLKDFARFMDDEAWKKAEGEDWKEPQKFFLDLAWDGWELYKRLKSEQFFSFLKKVEKEQDGNRKIVAPDGVPDGIVFPMLSALSRFIVNKKGIWRLEIPAKFPWRTLFQNAANLFKDTADHNPNTMGKHAGCYVSLHGLFDMFFAMSDGEQEESRFDLK